MQASSLTQLDVIAYWHCVLTLPDVDVVQLLTLVHGVLEVTVAPHATLFVTELQGVSCGSCTKFVQVFPPSEDVLW
jgi:hypothetical protein